MKTIWNDIYDKSILFFSKKHDICRLSSKITIFLPLSINQFIEYLLRKVVKLFRLNLKNNTFRQQFSFNCPTVKQIHI